MICRMVYVACDRCGIPAGGSEDMQDDAVDARRRAKRLGFVRVAAVSTPGGFEDLCPGCAKQVDA